MKVSLARTGNGPPEKNAVSRSSAGGAAAHLGDAEADADGVVVAPGNGAFRVTPALTLKLIRLRSPGAPIRRANTPIERGLSSGRPPDHLVDHAVDD